VAALFAFDMIDFTDRAFDTLTRLFFNSCITEAVLGDASCRHLTFFFFPIVNSSNLLSLPKHGFHSWVRTFIQAGHAGSYGVAPHTIWWLHTGFTLGGWWVRDCIPICIGSSSLRRFDIAILAFKISFGLSLYI
jgi:hypothetical protein